MDCMDDIVLIQASGVENDNAIQDLKVLLSDKKKKYAKYFIFQTTCKIKLLIVYRYDETKNVFYDITQTTTAVPLLNTSLKIYLERAADNIQYESNIEKKA